MFLLTCSEEEEGENKSTILTLDPRHSSSVEMLVDQKNHNSDFQQKSHVWGVNYSNKTVWISEPLSLLLYQRWYDCDYNTKCNTREWWKVVGNMLYTIRPMSHWHQLNFTYDKCFTYKVIFTETNWTEYTYNNKWTSYHCMRLVYVQSYNITQLVSHLCGPELYYSRSIY